MTRTIVGRLEISILRERRLDVRLGGQAGKMDEQLGRSVTLMSARSRSDRQARGRREVMPIREGNGLR